MEDIKKVYGLLNSPIVRVLFLFVWYDLFYFFISDDDCQLMGLLLQFDSDLSKQKSWHLDGGIVITKLFPFHEFFHYRLKSEIVMVVKLVFHFLRCYFSDLLNLGCNFCFFQKIFSWSFLSQRTISSYSILIYFAKLMSFASQNGVQPSFIQTFSFLGKIHNLIYKRNSILIKYYELFPEAFLACCELSASYRQDI